MVDDPIARIERSLIILMRRAADPRGNRQINARAGIDIDRAASVMLARIEELQPVRLSPLADAAGIEVSTASRQVGSLVEAGLVSREDDPDDRRAAVHRLTSAGAEVRRRLVVARRAWFEEKLAGFDEHERALFADLLERYVDQVHRDELPGRS